MESPMLLCLLFLLFGQCVHPKTLPRQKRDILVLEKCYGELGCFSTGGDFSDILVRPFQLLPRSRAEIDVGFTFFDRNRPVMGLALRAGDERLLEMAQMNASKPLLFVTHGFLESSSATWVYNIRRDLLIHGDVNVIEVNWGKGANPPYTQATANTRLVGAEIALLIRFLKNNTQGLDLSKIHLLGHSLGAHISGYAGKYFTNPKLGRVTGLDPAGPYFEGSKPAVRLDSGDADFVDVIHTNAGTLLTASYGIMAPIGHADFYLNDGRKQPGCAISNSIENLKDKGVVEAVACSHMRVVHYFHSSILSRCPFKAFLCADFATFKRGACLSCAKAGSCVPVGLNANKRSLAGNRPGSVYYLETGAKQPYCGYHYGIEIQFSSSAEKYGGKFYVSLNNELGDSSNTLTLPLDGKWFDIAPNRAVSGVQFFTKDQGVFESISLRWERERRLTEPGSWLGTSTTQIDRITVFDAQHQTSHEYCSNVELKTGETHNFVQC